MRELSVLLVDDEEHCLESLSWLLTEYCPVVTQISCLSDSRKVIDYLSENEVDILFLDIDMPHMTGFEVLSHITDRQFHLVFTTAFNEYAVQAFKARALDYLLKPVDKDELIVAVQRALDSGQGQPQESLNESSQKLPVRLAVSGRQGVDWVELDEIIRCESDNNYTTIYLRNGQRMVMSRTLKSLERELQEPKFIRVHRSHLVNIGFVKSLNSREEVVIHLDNGAVVPVSRRRRADVVKAMEGLTGG